MGFNNHLEISVIDACCAGAFFNGVFLLALALSIFLQSIERFIHIEPVESPMLVLIVGTIGLTLNIVSAIVIHGKMILDATTPPDISIQTTITADIVTTKLPLNWNLLVQRHTISLAFLIFIVLR
jgi:Co/Zn/Cd efflux system component